MPANLANLALFQATWFGCTLAAARGWDALALPVCALHLALHLRWIAPRRSEAALLLAVAAFGLVFDSLLTSLGVLAHPANPARLGLQPLWMLTLWLNFATTLNHSLRWLGRRPLLAPALGAIGGAGAYLAGARLGALAVAPGPIPILTLAAAWGLAVPALSLLARALEDQRVLVPSPPEIPS